MDPSREQLLREQHKRRLSWMPWLYFSLKPEQQAWVDAWQHEVQAALRSCEAVEIAEGCFIAPEARIFGEPRRGITIGAGSSIGADAFVHGPVTLGRNVSLNARVSLDGGAAGIRIGEGTRIATGATLYAFDHGLAPDLAVRDQPTRSRGISLGADVWLGANAGVTDGVSIGDHAVVGMGAVVTRDVAEWAIVGGVPARVIGDRREGKKDRR